MEAAPSESKGFEPLKHLSAFTRFPIVRLQPLGQLSLEAGGEVSENHGEVKALAQVESLGRKPAARQRRHEERFGIDAHGNDRRVSLVPGQLRLEPLADRGRLFLV